MFRVLILDDDPLFGKTLVRNLERTEELGCKAVAYTTSEQVYEAVRQAEEPFDVFLIDYRLGPGENGIDVLRELLRLSPRSEAVMFTSNDYDAGVQAYRAGAVRYLHKPFTIAELAMVLRWIQEWRKTKQQRDGLLILTEIARRAQRTRSVSELGDVIVEGGHRFGFQGARFWLREGEDLIGVSQYGLQGIPSISGIRFPICESPYASRTLVSREPIVFRSEEHGPSYHNVGSEVPSGEWVSLPLWAGGRVLGMLMLDNHRDSEEHRIHPAQLQELTLLGEHLAVALERVQLYEQEQMQSIELARKSRDLERANQEMAVLVEMSRLATNRAATSDLDTLLQEIHGLIGQLIDTSNMVIALHDTENVELDVRLRVEKGQRRPARRRSLRAGLLGYVVDKNQTLFLPQRNDEFRRREQIGRIGRPALSWLGVPLRVEGKAVGALAVQSYERENAFTEHDRQLLERLAAQVAGAIEAARLKEEAASNSRRLIALQRAGEELMKLAEQNEDWLWHTALTIATAGYALRFNRAMLFLTEDGGTVLCGHMGIGQLTGQQARDRWRQSRKKTFEEYICALKADELKPTEIDRLVRDVVLHLPSDTSALAQALQGRRTTLVTKQDAHLHLPELFLHQFGRTDYAIIPLLVGNKRLGIVVVDNIHNGEPLQRTLISQLETWLTQVALVQENQRQRHASDRLITFSLTMLGRVANLSLKETLQEICQAAQTITEADAVVIYPVQPEEQPGEWRYDQGNISHVGLRQAFVPHDHPTSGGVTAEVLLTRQLQAIDDVAKTDWYDDRRDIRNSFLLRENIRAMIVAPIFDVDDTSLLGVLYFDYRAPQSFSRHDFQRAQSFAALAGSAMGTNRVGMAVRQSRDLAESQRLARERELEILSGVLETALQPQVSRAEVAHSLLVAGRELLRAPSSVITLILREWKKPVDRSQEPKEVRRQYFLNRTDELIERPERPLYTGTTGLAFRTREDQYVPDVSEGDWQMLFQPREGVNGLQVHTRSELDVLIRQEEHQILGLFNVESPSVDAFTPTDHQVLRRLAAVAALALDNVRRQKNLRNVLNAAQAIMAPTDPETTLDAVMDAARRVAPEVSAVTIWYKEPMTGEIRSGPHFGVRQPDYMGIRLRPGGNVVLAVMQAGAPIWAEHAAEDPTLKGRFVVRERIESAAALPLKADGEVVGAIFFNYQQRHVFTTEERVLFPILATIAAASVRDALHLAELQKSREQQYATLQELEKSYARLNAAIEINEAIGATQELDRMLIAIMSTTHKLFLAPKLCVMIYDPKRHTLTLAPESREFYPVESLDPVTSLNIYKDKSIACRIARTTLAQKQIVYENIGDVSQDADYLSVSSTTKSELALALMSDERLLGVLVIERDHVDAFSADDVALVQSVGRSISIALDRAYQGSRLRFNASVAAATASVADMAHDIKHEIGNIRYQTYRLKPRLAAELQAYVDEIDRSADLLQAYSSPPESTELLENLPLDSWLDASVRSILQNRDANIDYRFKPGCRDREVRASAVLLERVMRHLIRNALEAMGPNDRLIIRTTHGEETAEVQVSNTGVPIPETIRQRLFVDQVSTKTDRTNNGRGGLGLLLVRWAVEAMGGTIELLSKPDEPVTFAFSLRLARPEQARSQ
jgi:GAF domain-containing protein/ActR/RegA family two-component response regulator